MESKRNINCDLMHVVSMFFVLVIHTDRSFVKTSFLGIVLTIYKVIDFCLPLSVSIFYKFPSDLNTTL